MLLMISGLSGAGKSTALHALEDLGFFCTDNLPAAMLPTWAEHVRHEHAAVCMDIRSSMEPDSLIEMLATVRKQGEWGMLFMDASSEILQRRFSTLRRKHPFRAQQPKGSSLESALAAEREALSPLKEMADLVLDSTTLNPYELADLVESFWRERSENVTDEDSLSCSFMSFSYQRGLPSEADMVIDLRFLPNPHYQPLLARQTGQDEDVCEFFNAYPEVAEAEEKLRQWLLFVWPKLKRERKRYFTLAIGCSGGRHRSVYMVERLA
ncbi:MAG: RNase adapter RapZ, partial [Mariprofundaceae bacterium]|nr:RNase adapter RapZ [Mariprofundaceae bacterium]